MTNDPIEEFLANIEQDVNGFKEIYSTDCTQADGYMLYTPKLLALVRIYREENIKAQKELDNIKYELEASVYTLEDTQFETVFEVRDSLYFADKKALEIVK